MTAKGADDKMVSRQRILLVGLGVMGRPYLAAVHAAGAQAVVVDGARQLATAETRALLREDDVALAVESVAVEGAPVEGMGDHTAVAVAGIGDEHWYLAANAALAGHRPDGVLAFADPQVRAAALLAEEFGLPGPGLRAVETSRNKAYQRALFARHGVPQPAFGLAVDAAGAAAWVAGHGGYPAVAKVLGGSASAGVRLVRDDADLAGYASEYGGPFLIEEYVDGPEASCEAVVHCGRVAFASLTDKLTGPAPYFVETRHTVPGARAERLRPQAQALVNAVVGALGIGNALLHLEFRCGPAGLRVIEFAVRTPGDFLMELVRLAHGVDLYAAAVALSLGRAPDVTPQRAAVAASWFPTYSGGRLRISGSQQQAERLPGVERVRVWGRPDTIVEAQRSSNDRIASAVVTAADHHELDRRLADLERLLGIVVTPS